MISICIVTHDRLDILTKVLEDIDIYCRSNYELVIVDDASTDLKVKEYLIAFKQRSKKPVSIYFNETSQYAAKAFNKAFELAKGDYLVHLESDTLVPYNGWDLILQTYLDNYKEVGLIAPDVPGCHIRLHRGTYDEVEWSLGNVWMIRRSTFEEVGGWDETLLHAFEIEYCYRLRMRGYRVGLALPVKRVHLDTTTDENKASDPTRKEKVHRGTFEFLRRLNLYYLGFFYYKSPFMITWEELPINRVFRKQVFCQEHLNSNPEPYVVQNHRMELIREIQDPGKYREKEAEELVEGNRILNMQNRWEDCDEDLLYGKRKWGIERDRI